MHSRGWQPIKIGSKTFNIFDLIMQKLGTSQGPQPTIKGGTGRWGTELLQSAHIFM